MMLILTRRVGETLMVGDDVTVTVLGVKGNQVRIGVNAPKDTPVHREEIYERIKKEPDGDGHKKTGITSNPAATANTLKLAGGKGTILRSNALR